MHSKQIDVPLQPTKKHKKNTQNNYKKRVKYWQIKKRNENKKRVKCWQLKIKKHTKQTGRQRAQWHSSRRSPNPTLAKR